MKQPISKQSVSSLRTKAKEKTDLPITGLSNTEEKIIVQLSNIAISLYRLKRIEAYKRVVDARDFLMSAVDQEACGLGDEATKPRHSKAVKSDSKASNTISLGEQQACL
jgi:hypothetical protein